VSHSWRAPKNWGGVLVKPRKQKESSAPPKNADPALAGSARAHGVHAPTAGETATPQRPSSSRRHTSRRDPRRRRAAPSTPAVCANQKPRAPLACDLQLASAAVSAARVSTRPLPTQAERTSAYREDLRLYPPDRGSPALPQVEHLYSDCRLAVFDQISIRHLVRPLFRHTSEECFVLRGRAPSPRTDHRPTA
jgi:hypothetical protein